MVDVELAQPRSRRVGSPGDGGAGAADRRAVPPLAELWRPVALFAASRLAVLLAHVATMAAVPGPGLGDLLVRWDGGWYQSIVQGGYSDQVPSGRSNIGFFPLYPLLAAGVDRLPGFGAVEALTVVSLVGGLVATVLLWLLTRELAGDDAADRATALFAFAPGAYVFSVAYSEGLFLAAAVGACWLLIRRSYLWGGVLCALATAVRPNGLALVAVAAVTAAVAIWERREWRALVAPAIAPLGFLGFLAFSWRHTGRFDSYFLAQHEGWNQSLSLTTWGTDVLHSLRVLFGDRPPDWNRIVPTIGLVVVAAGFVLLVRMRPPVELIVFSAAVCAIAVLSSEVGLRPRFVLTAFPILMALGVCLRQRLAFPIVLSLSATSMAVLVVVSSSSLYLTP